MAIAKTAVAVLIAASSTAGSTKASPGATGAAVDCRTYYGGELTYKITNGASAPGAPCVLTFQVSHDGFNWYDYMTVAGDTVASSVITGSILLDRGVMYVRGIAYGNTTNAVTVDATLQAVTGL
jgi:hypothetical protein